VILFCSLKRVWKLTKSLANIFAQPNAYSFRSVPHFQPCDRTYFKPTGFDCKSDFHSYNLVRKRSCSFTFCRKHERFLRQFRRGQLPCSSVSTVGSIKTLAPRFVAFLQCWTHQPKVRQLTRQSFFYVFANWRIAVQSGCQYQTYFILFQYIRVLFCPVSNPA
jgi:hypothetical protein